ncbi:hypothetical protein BDZ91DRAFT_681678, partial [Kalaharituber pfeilii]
MLNSSDPFPLNVEIDTQLLIFTVIVSFTIIYLFLHQVPELPSILDFFIMVVGTVMGEGTRQRLQFLFGPNIGRDGVGGAGMVERIRARANSLLSGNVYGNDGEEVVGGLWNMGNTCYQNSVLQAMASLRYLKSHLAILSSPEALNDEDLHPSAALVQLFETLNTVSRNHRSVYVPHLIRAVDTTNSGWMFNEQQDAQEFFQRLTAAVEKEVTRYWNRVKHVAGLESASLLLSGEPDMKIVDGLLKDKLMPEELKNPFEGLSAQRVGCLRCGYVEAIRLQAFTTLSLSLPSTYECTLDECLNEYIVIERIEQVECDKCTLLAQKRKLEKLLDQEGGPRLSPSEAQSSSASSSSSSATSNPTSKAKLSPELQATVTKRLELVNQALAEDDFTQATFRRLAIPSLKVTATKTKQTMIARPPPILVLHINRSQFDMVSGVTRKNFAAVHFPRFLDLGNVVTGVDGMDVDPGKPISSGAVNDSGEQEHVLYELKSVITHYGGHHNGHYICYRKTGKRWWRISDDRVAVVTIAEIRSITNAFMLFYEKISEEEVREMERRRIEAEEAAMRARLEREKELELRIMEEAKQGVCYGTFGERGKFGSETDVDRILSGSAEEFLRELVKTDGVGSGMGGRDEVEEE